MGPDNKLPVLAWWYSTSPILRGLKKMQKNWPELLLFHATFHQACCKSVVSLANCVGWEIQTNTHQTNVSVHECTCECVCVYVHMCIYIYNYIQLYTCPCTLKCTHIFIEMQNPSIIETRISRQRQIAWLSSQHWTNMKAWNREGLEGLEGGSIFRDVPSNQLT
jgi:hypothetical protein